MITRSNKKTSKSEKTCATTQDFLENPFNFLTKDQQKVFNYCSSIVVCSNSLTIYPRLDTIAERCACSERTVQRAFEVFEAVGILIKKVTRKYTSCLYTFHEFLLQKPYQKLLAKFFRAFRFLKQEKSPELSPQIPQEENENVVLMYGCYISYKLKRMLDVLLTINLKKAHDFAIDQPTTFQKKNKNDRIGNMENQKRTIDIVTRFYNICGQQLPVEKAKEIAENWNDEQLDHVFKQFKATVESHIRSGDQRKYTAGYLHSIKANMPKPMDKQTQDDYENFIKAHNQPKAPPTSSPFHQPYQHAPYDPMTDIKSAYGYYIYFKSTEFKNFMYACLSNGADCHPIPQIHLDMVKMIAVDPNIVPAERKIRWKLDHEKFVETFQKRANEIGYKENLKDITLFPNWLKVQNTINFINSEQNTTLFR